MVLLYDDQSSRELMKGVDLAQDAERIEEAKGHLRKDGEVEAEQGSEEVGLRRSGNRSKPYARCM